MNNTAIKVENLSKRYRIGLAEERYDSFGSILWSYIKSPVSNFKKLRRLSKFSGEDEEDIIWALKNINFEVKVGEVVGIIGRNGAGKSTLLKILSQITEPTEGRAIIKGKVSSLLEVGTGFHPELTGRENIYLNGTILGMSKKEIDSKFDEIVEFSGIKKFIDTPFKRYSSGMKVRLGFSVAAHLEPEILLVDEVLAVGDIAFQKKCLGKMEDVTAAGRTILFVSHNMQAIKNLCERCMLIDDGCIISSGRTNEVLKDYYKALKMNKIENIHSLRNSKNRRGLGHVRFNKVEILDNKGKKTNRFKMNDNVHFNLGYYVNDSVEELYVVIQLKSENTGEMVTSVKHKIIDKKLDKGDKGEFGIMLPDLNLRPGVYNLYYWLGNRYNKPYDVVDSLTEPLEVTFNDKTDHFEYNPNKSCGYFNIKSKIFL
ncbi:MAG: ABC transporter ATP-binding protein [bacterium]